MFQIEPDLADKFEFYKNPLLKGAGVCWCYYSKEINPDEIKKSLADTSYFSKIPKEKILRDSRNLLAHYEFTIKSQDLFFCEKKEFILKKFRNKSIADWLKYGLRTSKAVRGWKKTYEFLKRGINTPRPFLLLEKRWRFILLYSCLMVEKINNFIPLREILTKYRKDKKGIYQEEKKIFLDKLARYIKNMHDSGIIHRDLSGGNILIQNARHLDKMIFSVIDINRARIRENPTFKDRMKDLERIRIEPDDRIFFFKSYCSDNVMFERNKETYLKRVERYRYERKHKPLFKKLFRKLFE